MTPAQIQMTRNYADFQGFGALRAGARAESRDAAHAVGRQLEALFIQMMLKSMREASLGATVFDSDQSRVYRDLFDKQVAIDLAAKGDLKLADMMMRQLGVERDEPSLVADEDPFRAEGARELEMPPVPTAAQRELAAQFLARAARVEGAAREPVYPGATAEADPWNGVVGQGAATPARPAAGNARIRTPEDFVRILKPHAEAAAREIGVRPEVLLAQAALETGWGSRMIKRADGSNSHNLFGIKAGASWNGDRARVSTLEFVDGIPRREIASFRAYGSYAESFQDYVSFLQSHPRYAQALERSHDPRAFMRSLQQAGYATDPQYARKVVDVMQRSVIADAARISNGL